MSTTASFKVETTEDGTVVAKTTTSWSRSFGKCKRQDFSRQGEIFTRGRLLAWAKKYGVKVSPEVAAAFPTKVWWLS
jgi:hypothetical protein